VNKKIIAAIHESIKKWDCIAQGIASDEGASNCPLCAMFFSNNCVGCPVMLFTGHEYCQFTPYANTLRIVAADECGHNGFTPIKSLQNDDISECQFLAVTQEVEFLISLLPDDEQHKYEGRGKAELWLNQLLQSYGD